MTIMRKLFGIIGTFAGLTAIIVSCNKQEIAEPKIETVEMTIVAGSDETKTVMGIDGSVTWSASGEQLAVIEAAVSGTETTTAKETSKEGVTTDGCATMTFGVSMTSKTADSFGYYALYPNSAYVDKPTDLAKVKVELASTQAPTESSFGPSADVLVAKPVTGLTAQPKELNLQFARVIAIGKMTIKNLNTGENVKKVTFTAAGKAVTGKSYINFTNAEGVEYGYSSFGVDNVVLDYSDKNIAANGMTAVFTCWPFKLAAGETFSVVVETENYTFKKDITLAEGKSLAFNVGRASKFNVNFDGIEGVQKPQASQLVADGAYVVAQGSNIMTVGTTSESYRGVATIPAAANDDGSYSVEATAAWNFVYDSATDSYKISSASDNTLYLQGSSTDSDFKLVAEANATSFTITKDEAGTYKISNGEKSIGINKGTTPYRFAMYAGSTQQPVDLNLYPAKVVILPKIDVQETLEIPSAETTASFPVTLTNAETVDVNVYSDADCTIAAGWITADFNTDQTAIDYVVNENTTSEARTAYIKISAVSSDASKVAAIVTVTQVATGTALSKTATYTVTSTSAVSASGDAPSGSSATYSSTYSTVNQLTSGNSMTLTLSGYKGMIVKGLTLSMRSNSSKGAGYLSVKTGTSMLSSIGTSSSGVNFNNALWNGAWSTSYVDVRPTLSNDAYTIQNGENLVIVIGATANSLYCQSFTIEYVADPSFVGGSDPVKLSAPVVTCTAQTETSLTFSWDAVANASGYQVSTDGGSTYGATRTETTYTWTGLLANTTKTLYVKAIGDGTNYTDSDAASASGTTTAASTGVEEKSEEIVLANGTYSGSGTAGIITWSGTSCTFVQTKEDSSSNVNSSFVSAPRWYQGHKVTFTANTSYTITKVVVVCTSNSYATALGNSTYSTGASASVSGSTVTITTSGNFDVTMGAQSRISSVTVYYSESSN